MKNRVIPSVPDDLGPLGGCSDVRTINKRAVFAIGRGRQCHKDLQRSIGWQRKDPGTESPTSAAATAPGKSHERFSGNTGFVLGQIVPAASKAASPDTAICKADTDSHHAHPRTVHHRLDLLGTARIGENLDVDAKAVGVYVQGGNGHDSVFLVTEYRIDGERGGQCALRRPIPSGRRPLTLRRF
jgi:hypothetical protein